MTWKQYKELKIQSQDTDNIKKKYSVTSDILSFQLCRRQYGFFAIRDYQPAHVVQIWYGTIIHQVLDKLHMHYLGHLDSSLKGKIPKDIDVEKYFVEVDDSLKARGIKAITQQIRETALSALKEFNKTEGPQLYPNVIDSECNLQVTNTDYILYGIVDVLRNSSQDINCDLYDPVEIWDYKGAKNPKSSKREDRKKLENYTFQMLVYGELYKIKKGKYPSKGVIYFINELKDPESVKNNKHISIIDFTNPDNLKKIREAMDNFSETVSAIQYCKESDSWEPPDKKNLPGEETCDICDLRWSCLSVQNKYHMRSITSRKSR